MIFFFLTEGSLISSLYIATVLIAIGYYFFLFTHTKKYTPTIYLFLAAFFLLGSGLAHTLGRGSIPGASEQNLHAGLGLGSVLGIVLIFLHIAHQFHWLWQQTNTHQAATQAKSEFLTNMSHEIRTPLNAIIGMGELLETADFSAEEKKYLKILQNASKNLMGLINDILDISKIEAGRIELEKILFDPEVLIKDTIKFLAPEAKNKGLELHCNIQPSLGTYEGDPTRIRQVLVNLTSNAIKFTHRGYVKISAVSCSGQMLKDMHISPPKDLKRIYLLLTIKDTGIGIPMEKWETIFDTFSQADPSTTRRFGGSGLGLAITRHLVQVMGGRIWVESFENSGTSFYCLFPFAAKHQEAPKKIIGTENKENLKTNGKMVTRPLHILLVEDNLDNQVLFEAYFKKTPHTVQIADNGERAIEHIYEKNFDLVFMDIQMPVLDGLTATRQIREWERSKSQPNEAKDHLPIYALTAHAMKTEIEKSITAGCDGHITKPLKKSELFSIINKHTT